MDLTRAITPKSDQLNAEDLLTGPRTFTITGVDEGSIEQPVNVHLAEMPGRPWRPSKSMSRVLAFAWGKETTPYAGRRVTLYRDPEVTFGRDKVGGIKISHLTNIDGPKSVSLTVTRGKRKPHEVKPLTDSPTPTQPAPVTPPLVAAFEASGIDKSQWLAYSGQVVKRELTNANDLTAAEQVAVVDALNQDAAEKAAEGQA